MTRDEMQAAVRAHPRFMYSYSPENTEADRRWCFQDATFFSLEEAYIYTTV